MAAAAIAFALAPALVNANGLIDYSTATGAKIYNGATKSLSEGGYDLSSEELNTFLAAFDDRIVEYGWEAVFSIPEDAAVAAQGLHMLTTEYGVITMNQVNAHVQTYINNNDRNCQNSFQAFNCAMSSLTDAAKKKINLKRNQFTVAGIGSGPLLLKVIIQTAYVDTRSTVLHLREQLSRLDVYMVDVKSDVERFNDYVTTLVAGLSARGEETLDLLSNLFKGYMAVSDNSFIDFIKRKKDAYEEGDLDLTPDFLMQATVNKYNGLKQQGRWNQASQQDEKIIALEAQVKALKNGGKKTAKELKSKKDVKLPVWVKIPPAEGESETKNEGAKTHYRCNNHKKWSINPKHTTQQCKGFGIKDKEGTEQTASSGTVENATPGLRLASALAATVQGESDDEE
jgi:hypothetical protein